MKIYIAGPMRGHYNYNFSSFHDAMLHLRAQGFEVVSPHEKEAALDGTPLLGKIPKKYGGRSCCVTPGDMRRADFKEMLECDAIALLPGWEQSIGSLDELLIAQVCEMAVFELVNVHRDRRRGQYDWRLREIGPQALSAVLYSETEKKASLTAPALGQEEVSRCVP